MVPPGRSIAPPKATKNTSTKNTSASTKGKTRNLSAAKNGTATLEKAKLMVYSAPYNDAKAIEFMFNPEQISFRRSVDWMCDRGNRGTTLLPKANFSGVSPYTFELSNLLFDTYEIKEDVMTKYIDNIKEGVTARPGEHARPPVYIFTWKNEYFHCVMTSLTYKLTMFLSDGTPVRASVDISLQEVDPNDTATAQSRIGPRRPNPRLGNTQPAPKPGGGSPRNQGRGQPRGGKGGRRR